MNQRIFLVAGMVWIFCFVVPCVHAQKENALEIADAHFLESLGDLKQSVENLQINNAKLREQNSLLQGSVNRLNSSLDPLVQEERNLAQMVAKAQEISTKKAAVITQLENQLADVQSRIEIMKGEQTVKQEALEQQKKRDIELSQEINVATADLAKVPEVEAPSPSIVPVESEEEKNEKRKITSLMNDAQLKQDRLRQQILLAQKKVLATDIRPVVAPVVNNDQMSNEINSLQKNYEQLSDLYTQLQKKMQAVPLKSVEITERKKLEGTVLDLKTESGKLRMDLDGLRTQLVELDKRKSYLEQALK